MHTNYHTAIGSAASIPISPSNPIISFSPIVIPSPNRPVDLEVRLTIPFFNSSGSTSKTLPVLVLSHGHGPSNHLSSLEGYAPLAEFYASHGFAVLQPTHLSSAFLGLASASPPGDELHYRSRPADISLLLDSLALLEAAVPLLGHSGHLSLSRDRIAVVGHSLGGYTASLALGASNTDPRSAVNPDNSTFRPHDSRIMAGAILGATGAGGTDLSDIARDHLAPFYGISFDTMTAPALVVYGDEDISPHLTVRGADWHGDAYRLAPGPKDLLVLKGAGHGLGGVSGWDAAENVKDESPEKLAIVQRMTWAYLWSQLHEGSTAWDEAVSALKGMGDKAVVENKK